MCYDKGVSKENNMNNNEPNEEKNVLLLIFKGIWLIIKWMFIITFAIFIPVIWFAKYLSKTGGR